MAVDWPLSRKEKHLHMNSLYERDLDLMEVNLRKEKARRLSLGSRVAYLESELMRKEQVVRWAPNTLPAMSLQTQRIHSQTRSTYGNYRFHLVGGLAISVLVALMISEQVVGVAYSPSLPANGESFSVDLMSSNLLQDSADSDAPQLQIPMLMPSEIDTLTTFISLAPDWAVGGDVEQEQYAIRMAEPNFGSHTTEIDRRSNVFEASLKARKDTSQSEQNDPDFGKDTVQSEQSDPDFRSYTTEIDRTSYYFEASLDAQKGTSQPHVGIDGQRIEKEQKEFDFGSNAAEADRRSDDFEVLLESQEGTYQSHLTLDQSRMDKKENELSHMVHWNNWATAAIIAVFVGIVVVLYSWYRFSDSPNASLCRDLTICEQDLSAAKPIRERKRWPSKLLLVPEKSPEHAPGVPDFKRSRRPRTATPDGKASKLRGMYLLSADEKHLYPRPYPFKSPRLREVAEREAAVATARLVDNQEREEQALKREACGGA